MVCRVASTMLVAVTPGKDTVTLFFLAAMVASTAAGEGGRTLDLEGGTAPVVQGQHPGARTGALALHPGVAIRRSLP